MRGRCEDNVDGNEDEGGAQGSKKAKEVALGRKNAFGLRKTGS